MAQLRETDRDALERCMAIAMRDPMRAEQLNFKLEEESWFDVADFACYCVQGDIMQLKPWQEPPSVADEDDSHDSDRDAQNLLRRMLEAGVSRYDPDPLTALAKKKPKRK